jgi:hypothetical protein
MLKKPSLISIPDQSFAQQSVNIKLMAKIEQLQNDSDFKD